MCCLPVGQSKSQKRCSCGTTVVKNHEVGLVKVLVSSVDDGSGVGVNEGGGRLGGVGGRRGGDAGGLAASSAEEPLKFLL